VLEKPYGLMSALCGHCLVLCEVWGLWETHVGIVELLCTLEGNRWVVITLWCGRLMFEGCINPSVDCFSLRIVLDTHKWYQSLDLASLLYETQGPQILHQIQ